MSEAVDAPEFDLRGQLRGLWRRRLLITLVVLLVVGSSLLASWLQTPLYQGEVRILFERSSTESLFAVDEEQREPARVIKDEMEVIKSEAIEQAVREKIGGDTQVSVEQVSETDVVIVKSQSTDRARAAISAKAYAEAYIEFRKSQALADLQVATRSVEAKVNDLQSQIESLDAQINDAVRAQIEAAVQQARGTDVDPAQFLSSEPIAGLNARRSQLLSQQGGLKERLDGLVLASELQTGGARLVSATTVPTFQIAPRPIRNAIVALILGLVVGIGLALIFEYLDDRITSAEELARVVPGVPLLGLIPLINKRRRDVESPVSLSEPSSHAAEAYRSLRTALQFVGVERAPKVFQVTSSNADEGKSSVVGNLGVALARGGQRVVLVDCDLRRATLHDMFSLSNSVGFTSAFLHRVDLDAAVQSVPDVENLAVLTSGPLPPNPSELLSAKRTAEMMTVLQETYDIVLVDSTPVLPLADAVAVSVWMDATILVVSADSTLRRDLRRTLEILRHAEAPIVGTVLNRVTAGDHYVSYYDDRPRRGKATPSLSPSEPPATPTEQVEVPPAEQGSGRR